MYAPPEWLRVAPAEHTFTTSISSGGCYSTEHVQVPTMLCRDECASGAQIAEAMDGAPHPGRGFLACLAKNGIEVDVLEPVRQISRNKQDAQGSYTVYGLATEPRS